MDLKKYWAAWTNFRVSNSEPRKILIDLTSSFTDAVQNITQPQEMPAPAKSGLYSLYAGTKDLELAGSKHSFLRLINPSGEIECDIHGVKKPVGKNARFAPITAIIEPKDFEHFVHLKDNEPILLWQGTAQEAGHKMKLAMALVDRIEETKRPYHLLSQNCNTLFHSLLKVMDVELPRHMPAWLPGLHRVLYDDVDFVKKQYTTNPSEADAGWLSRFTERLSLERETIVQTFGDLKKASFSSPLPAQNFQAA